MRISDWSSDVCSSDVLPPPHRPLREAAAPPSLLKAVYSVNAPSMSWKKEAAIGGAVTIRTVKINPSPPCCNAMLLMPSVVAPVQLPTPRSEEHTSEIQSLMRISYAVFCLKHKKNTNVKKR